MPGIACSAMSPVIFLDNALPNVRLNRRTNPKKINQLYYLAHLEKLEENMRSKSPNDRSSSRLAVAANELLEAVAIETASRQQMQLSSDLVAFKDSVESKMSTNDSKMTAIEAKISAIDQTIDSKCDVSDLMALKDSVESKMSTVDSKLITIESKISTICQTDSSKCDASDIVAHKDSVESKMSTFDSKMTTLESKIRVIDQKIDPKCDSRDQMIDSKLDSPIQITDSKLSKLTQTMDSKLSTLTQRFINVDNSVSSLEKCLSEQTRFQSLTYWLEYACNGHNPLPSDFMFTNMRNV